MRRKMNPLACCVVAALVLVWSVPSSHAAFVWRDESVRTNDNWSDPNNWYADEAGTPKGAAPGAVVNEIVIFRFPIEGVNWGTSVLDDGDHELTAGLRIDRQRDSGTLNLGGNTLSVTGDVSSIGGNRSDITITNGTMVFGSGATAVSALFYDTNFSGGNDLAATVTYTASTTVWFRNVTSLTVGIGTINRRMENATLDLSAAAIVGQTIAVNDDFIVGHYSGASPSIDADGTAKLPGTLTHLTVGDQLVVGENLRSTPAVATAPAEANGVLNLGGGATLSLTARSLVIGHGDKATGSVVNAPTTLDLTVGSLASRGVIHVGYNDRTQNNTATGDNPTTGSMTSNGGTFSAYLTELRVGQNTQAGANGSATGTFDMSAATLGTLDISGAAIIGSGLAGDGIVKLRGGSVSVGLANSASLTVGSTSAGSSGLLELRNVRWAVAGATNINGAGGSDLGQVVTEVYGLSSGLDLGPAATLSVGSNGRIEIIFVQDPLEVPENFGGGAVLWGLRWSGSHLTTLQTLFGSGLLFWDDSALTRGQASIFELNGFTYVGLTIPEPASAGLAGLGVTWLLRRRRGLVT